MVQVYTRHLDTKDVERIHKLEMMDEFEEPLHLNLCRVPELDLDATTSKMPCGVSAGVTVTHSVCCRINISSMPRPCVFDCCLVFPHKQESKQAWELGETQEWKRVGVGVIKV